jgi:hypothetical protein
MSRRPEQSVTGTEQRSVNVTAENAILFAFHMQVEHKEQ